MPRQDEVFTKEGDQWFLRQNGHFVITEHDQIVSYLNQSGWKPKSVLDIGSSNGYRLDDLLKRFPGATGSGIEISGMAVEDGRKRYPHLSLRQGMSHDLSAFADRSFDTVIISFVFHWVDRSLLLKTVSEIDRVLAEGGRLLIRDFAPLFPCKTPYHHLPGQEVFTYKQPYGDIYLASRLYRTLY